MLKNWKKHGITFKIFLYLSDKNLVSQGSHRFFNIPFQVYSRFFQVFIGKFHKYVWNTVFSFTLCKKIWIQENNFNFRLLKIVIEHVEYLIMYLEKNQIYNVFCETNNMIFTQIQGSFKVCAQNVKIQGIFKASRLYCPNSRIQGPWIACGNPANSNLLLLNILFTHLYTHSITRYILLENNEKVILK